MIVITPNNINFKTYDPIDVRKAYYYVAHCMKRYMFYPGKVENIDVVFNASGMGLGSLGVFFTFQPLTFIDANKIKRSRSKC